MMLRLDIENSKREAVEKASKESFAKGEAKGKAEGKAEGRAEGRAEGKAEGKDERSLEIARAMKAAGESAEKISAYTGLSVDMLQTL